MSTSNPAVTFATRGTQVLFAIVVFGLSCSLINGHEEGALPPTLRFAAFIGELSFVGALFGVAANWMQVQQGQFGLLIDAVIAGINLAGGILMAIKMKGVSCGKIDFYDMDDDELKDLHDTLWNEIICGGIKKIKSQDYPNCHYYTTAGLGTMMSRCKMASADSAFMFLTARGRGVDGLDEAEEGTLRLFTFKSNFPRVGDSVVIALAGSDSWSRDRGSAAWCHQRRSRPLRTERVKCTRWQIGFTIILQQVHQ